MPGESIKEKTDASVNGSSHDNLTFNKAAVASAELAPHNYCSDLPSVGLFLEKYHQYPCTLECDIDPEDNRFHVTTIVEYLAKEFDHDPNVDCVIRHFDRKIKRNFFFSRVMNIRPGVMIHIMSCSMNSDVQNPNKLTPDHSENCFLVAGGISIFYLPEHHQLAENLYTRFVTMTVFAPSTCTLQMVCRNQHGYYLSGIKIKKPLITDMGLHYGRKFIPIHERIIQNLNQKEGKGIVLLHGIPGSGKTHYIRYLIQEIKDKTLIYIPPDMAKEISSPAFLPFLMEYPDSILIVEDAENIIKDRNETTVPSQAVANLLNLSDGLLGDAMHQQIIATFNCDLTTIDPALLRKGRLIANYEFNKLDLESSKILSEKLGFGIDRITEPMTLAEIYNQDEEPEKTSN